MRRLLLTIPLLLPLVGLAAVFDTPELQIAPSPADARQLRLPAGVRVLDFDVSPTGPKVALLLVNAAGAREVQLWDIAQPQAAKALDIPAGFEARSIAWHPLGTSFFLAAPNSIQKVEMIAGAWKARQIFGSPQEIRRLVPGPRPYLISDAASKKEIPTYRLFFALKAADGAYSIRSVTEEGKKPYQIVGRKSGFTKIPDAEQPPSEIESSMALPVGFHPAGHLLLWEDGKHCFQVANYGRDRWEKSAALMSRELCGGTVSATPNGAGILHWQSGRDGVELYLQQGAIHRREATGHQLVSAPSSVPDGRGIVGVTRAGSDFALEYIPIQVPLADIVNAWMFLESPQDTQRFVKNGGLFRDLTEMDQLYSLYDTEAYECGQYDESTPTRPYLVTSDAFWELFAAAYEGIFIVRERQTSIPAFWQFVAKAHASLQQSHPQSRWTGVFAALNALGTGAKNNEEAARILKSAGSASSPILGAQFDYGELKPRGHYASTPASQNYFRGFRYLTRVWALNWDTAELRQLPDDVKAAAVRWIGAYADMIAPSRSPLLWSNQPFTPPLYNKRPQSRPALFPLSWGFDNEILYSAVYHADAPPAERIDGRMLPSALDVAAALGSRTAREFLASEIAKYPKLAAVLDGLQSRPHTEAKPNLYSQWIDSLAVQWADSVASPNGQLDQALWRAKRLQTGLASWATLRHATVLVNERTSAECGEGGFESILMRPPRGYVEPDPQTFGRIAALFDTAIKLVSAPDATLTGMLPADPGDDPKSRAALKQGLLKRLAETAAKARLFQAMAMKETRNQPLTAAEYEEILRFGRVAEHHFLIFKSLANKDLALSTPNPVPKIADVADVSGSAPYRMVAVGRPLEWDHTVPYFGRRQIVKGASYSFYEFASPTLLTDAEWLQKLAATPRPDWIAPFVSPDKLSCPAKNPF